MKGGGGKPNDRGVPPEEDARRNPTPNGLPCMERGGTAGKKGGWEKVKRMHTVVCV